MITNINVHLLNHLLFIGVIIIVKVRSLLRIHLASWCTIFLFFGSIGLVVVGAISTCSEGRLLVLLLLLLLLLAHLSVVDVRHVRHIWSTGDVLLVLLLHKH
jgi:hypothetical protein